MSKQSLTLIMIWIILLGLSLPLLFFIADKSLYLYVLIASLIIVGNAIYAEIIPLNPVPMERNFVAFCIGLMGMIGLLLSWLILKGSISPEDSRYMCLGAGIGASLLTGLVLFDSLQKRKIIQ